MFYFRWLVKHSGFHFELEPRDPSCLPKELPNARDSTCYFLNGYSHPTVDQGRPLTDHISEAVKTISNVTEI